MGRRAPRVGRAAGDGARAGRGRGVARQHSLGRLTIRERIARLTDDGSFDEVGSLTGKGDYDELGQLIGFTPSNIVFGNASSTAAGRA